MPQFGRQFSGRQGGRLTYRSLLHSLSTLVLLALMVVVVAACAGVNDSGSHDDFLATQAANAPADGDGHGGGDEGDATPEPDAEATVPAGGDEGNGGGEDLAAMGQELASTNACLGCHSIDGSTLVGPTWQGLYGAEVTLDDGSTVTADDEYLAESIVDPGAKIHEGFANIMPATGSSWTEEQINAVIAYIQSLE